MPTPFSNALQSAVDRLTGTARVNNMNNPQSAAYKTQQQKVRKVPAAPFKSTLPKNQKTFGIGVGP